MDRNLATAVETAYKTFSKYELQGELCICRCPVCVDAETERLLRTTPLRSTSSGLLAQYTHSAHVWDDRVADQFRYFLPRYFELIAQDDAPDLIATETSLERLADADYSRNWSRQEAAAIDRFWLALFLDRLGKPEEDWSGRDFLSPAHSSIEEILCLVALAAGKLAPLLQAWDMEAGCYPTLHLATLIEAANWSKRRLRSTFWFSRHDQPSVTESMSAIIDWLLTEHTRSKLEAAFLNQSDPVAAELLSKAEQTVAAMLPR